MRLHTLLALGAASFLALGANNAFAQMNSDEILQRLMLQQGATQSDDTGATRGMKLNYGTAEPEPAEAESSAPTAAIVPAAPEQTAVAVPVPSAVEEVPAIAVSTTPTRVPVESMPVPVATATPAVEEPSPAPEIAVSTETAPAAPSEPAPAVSVATAPAQIDPEPSNPPAFDFSNAATEQTAPEAAPEPQLTAARDTEEYKPVQEEARVDLRIYFEWNSAALRPDAVSQLAELCTAIQAMTAEGSNRFKIIGHTDKSGSADYNLYLSRARAREVKRHLIEECALPEDALIATGEGERQSSPSTPSQAPEERRVEVQLIS